MQNSNKHSHYFKDVSQLDTIDVYRVLELFNVVNPCIQHAVKKLLVAGGRGAGKDINKDIQEAIDSLERWKDMRQEENPIFNRRSTDKIPEVEFPEVGEPEEIKNTGKFKIGDLVICQGLEEVCIPAEFNGKVGKVIDNTDFDYTVEFNEEDAACNVWCIWEKLMQPYVEPKREFEVGDKVRILSHRAGMYVWNKEFGVGCLGQITSTSEYCLDVKVLDGEDAGEAIYLYPDEVTHV
jgi:ribosomal protein L21E